MKPPIADPFAPPAPPDEQTRVFPQSFWRVYFGTALLTFLILVPMIALWPLMRQVFLGSGQSFMLFFLVFINPLSAAFSMTFLHPTRITRFGVQGPPAVGFVEWNQMKSARAIWFGLPYARIPARNHFFALWIPLCFKDKKAFARAVEEWAPADNPLRLFLQKRGF